jgi:hypothetical protein
LSLRVPRVRGNSSLTIRLQNIVIDKPYKFVPPDYGTFWPRLLGRFVLPAFLRSSHGIESYELLGIDRLKASVAARHGILLTRNHCRACDPMVIAHLGFAIGAPIHIMASWHLLMQSRVQRWLLQHVGVFSVYREGMDPSSGQRVGNLRLHLNPGSRCRLRVRTLEARGRDVVRHDRVPLYGRRTPTTRTSDRGASGSGR